MINTITRLSQALAAKWSSYPHLTRPRREVRPVPLQSTATSHLSTYSTITICHPSIKLEVIRLTHLSEARLQRRQDQDLRPHTISTRATSSRDHPLKTGHRRSSRPLRTMSWTTKIGLQHSRRQRLMLDILVVILRTTLLRQTLFRHRDRDLSSETSGTKARRPNSSE